ncbi:MAG: hypothetical protein A4E65_03677 [Syntrophorhabdus sp. PtaU1.Bin153]|nr:MAG: hypothetical protein A4E65_03677 [Syntrophorhabdus sp. PtaU1.Bin153]
MSNTGRFMSVVRKLKKIILGRERDAFERVTPSETSINSKKADSTAMPHPSQSTPRTREDPYFIQIGLDFGTSFSKCVVRDVMTDKARVFVPPGSGGRELPFLIPSVLSFADGILRHIDEPAVQYIDQGLYHLKQALALVALRQWDHPLLSVYRVYGESRDEKKLSEFIENCAVYYLAGVIGNVRKSIRLQFEDFGARHDDYIAVNLAVPVKDAQQPEIADLYLRVLSESWSLSDEFAGHPSVRLNDLRELRKKASLENAGDNCFVYPEVSASVQGFVRSRVSSDGIYLFSDVGAETVDQSVFVLSRISGSEHLTYLHGSVLHLGSSHIERLAAEYSGSNDVHALESWRRRKEADDACPELLRAKQQIEKELSQCTTATLANSKKKLYRKDQLGEVRLIFGGGGHTRNPYETAVMEPFSGNLFRQAFKPGIIGLPFPKDLETRDLRALWMKRLYVAYGLSYERSMLASFTYPKDVSTPEPRDIWIPFKEIPDAPGKEEC